MTQNLSQHLSQTPSQTPSRKSETKPSRWAIGLSLGWGASWLALAPAIAAPLSSPGAIAPITPIAPIDPLAPVLTLAQARADTPNPRPAAAIDPALLQLWDQGRQEYEAGRYRAALDRWHQALATLPAPLYPGEPPSLTRLQTLNYLAVAYQELGQYQNANEATAAVVSALADRPQRSTAETLLFAQALNRRGQGELEQGQPAQALATWQAAEVTYRAVDNQAGQWGSRLNQARALQALGYYRQAKTQLQALAQDLQPLLGPLPSGSSPPGSSPSGANRPGSNPSPLAPADRTTIALEGGLLHSLGMALESLGELDTAQDLLKTVLEKDLARSHSQNHSSTSLSHTLTLISLGNLARTREETDLALGYYRQAQSLAPSPLLQLQTQLNELRLLTQAQRFQAALDLLDDLDPQWATLDPSRSKIYARLNFAASLLALWEQAQTIPPNLPQRFRLQTTSLDRTTFSPDDLAAPLVAALAEARSLGDRRAQAQTLTQLSQLYGRLEQWSAVATVATEGLALAQGLAAPDLIAPLAWQLAQAETALGDRAIALDHYQTAFTALQQLRSDLLTVNPEVQLTFRDTVEPLYRDYVSLLLAPETPSQEHLQRAREVMEALQVAELDNYFREACIDSQPVALDTLDPRAAIVYPIVLADRLEIIISRPNHPLLHYRQNVPGETVTGTAQQLYNLILRRNQRDIHLELSQRLYDWLIRPALADLAASQTETLVFIPDTPLRRLPMAVLHNGEGYLLEDYNVVFSPGLQLLPQGEQRDRLSALGVGITIPRDGFEGLPGVAKEVDYLSATLDSEVLMDQAFTRAAFTQQLNQKPFSVVHVATHGQFSSDPEQTFLLAWDDRITLADFDQILAPRKIGAIAPIELLVLSACQTASGDDRAPLGLAGFALKSGARSTLASLWSVSDEATALLMTDFYRHISSPDSPSFAEALRQAQLTQIRSTHYSHPSFWSAFVLVGNWR